MADSGTHMLVGGVDIIHSLGLTKKDLIPLASEVNAATLFRSLTDQQRRASPSVHLMLTWKKQLSPGNPCRIISHLHHRLPTDPPDREGCQEGLRTM